MEAFEEPLNVWGVQKGARKKGAQWWDLFLALIHHQSTFSSSSSPSLTRLAAEEETRAKSFRIRRWVDTVMDEGAFSILDVVSFLS